LPSLPPVAAPAANLQQISPVLIEHASDFRLLPAIDRVKNGQAIVIVRAAILQPVIIAA
jgi:hypothetical protein